MLCFPDSECLKTKRSPPTEPLLHSKRTAQPLDRIFTSSPISAFFKKPIFKVKTPINSSQPLETSNPIENKDNQQNSHPQDKAEAAGLKQVADSSNEIKVEPHTLEPSTVTTPPSCESEPPSAATPDEEEEEGDQTIFCTPELFEDDSHEGSPQKATKAESPPRMTSPVVLSEKLFEHAQGQGQASPSHGQSAISVIEEGQREGIGGRKEGEEREEVENQSSQTVSGLHRLSRSRQKAPSTLTGN